MKSPGFKPWGTVKLMLLPPSSGGPLTRGFLVRVQVGEPSNVPLTRANANPLESRGKIGGRFPPRISR